MPMTKDRYTAEMQMKSLMVEWHVLRTYLRSLFVATACVQVQLILLMEIWLMEILSHLRRFRTARTLQGPYAFGDNDLLYKTKYVAWV